MRLSAPEVASKSTELHYQRCHGLHGRDASQRKSSLNVITKALLAATLSAATAQSQCIASSAFDYDLRPRNNISVLKRYVTIIIKDHNGFGARATDDNNGLL